MDPWTGVSAAPIGVPAPGAIPTLPRPGLARLQRRGRRASYAEAGRGQQTAAGASRCAGGSPGPRFAQVWARVVGFSFLFERASVLGGDREIHDHSRSLNHNTVISHVPFGTYLQSKPDFLCYLMKEHD